MDLQRTQIERQFDRAAKTYDEVASLQRAMADHLLQEIGPDREGDLVDLGCGTGDLLAKVSQGTQLKLTGVDLSAEMLARASQRLETATFMKADLVSLPFLESKFDIVVSNAAIQWCDPQQAFEEMLRVLRPGGRLLVSTFGPATMGQWRDATGDAASSSQRVHEFPRLEDLQKRLQNVGFSDVLAERQLRDLEFETVEQMLDSIRKLGATNARRDRAQGLSGRAWLVRLREDLEQMRDRDGKLWLTYECLYLFARK